jgi:hypothetical protein
MFSYCINICSSISQNLKHFPNHRQTFARQHTDENLVDNYDLPLYQHPFGEFDSILSYVVATAMFCVLRSNKPKPKLSTHSYVDRVCYRLPDSIRAEGGLGVHLDRNVNHPYESLEKWRPIQAFVALTDQFGSDSGGLRVTRQFHTQIARYDFRTPPNESERGEFHRVNQNRHHQLCEQCQPVNCSAGSLVCWDNRLPHATAAALSGGDTREVVYVGFLPDVALNRRYVEAQAAALRANRRPPAYLADGAVDADRDWDIDDRSLLTDAQRALLCLAD